MFLLLSCRSLFTAVEHCVLIVKLLAACLLHDREAGEDSGWSETWWHSTNSSEGKRKWLRGSDAAADCVGRPGDSRANVTLFINVCMARVGSTPWPRDCAAFCVRPERSLCAQRAPWPPSAESWASTLWEGIWSNAEEQKEREGAGFWRILSLPRSALHRAASRLPWAATPASQRRICAMALSVCLWGGLNHKNYVPYSVHSANIPVIY